MNARSPIMVLSVALSVVAGCGGGNSQDPPGGSGGGGTSPGFNVFTVGGTVSGLAGQGLKLALLNLGNTAHHTTTLESIEIGANGAYSFRKPPPQNYEVIITSQPFSPAQQCAVRNAVGTVDGAVVNITNAEVMCGAFAYAADTSRGTVSSFSVDAVTGALESTDLPVNAAESAGAIAAAPDKKFLYVANSESNEISIFAVDLDRGTLTPTAGSPFAAGTNPRALVLRSVVGQTYSGPTFGRYLFATNAGSDSVWAYAIDPDTGRPLDRAMSFATGAGPSALAIDPSGPFLFTANRGGSNDISGFVISGSGLLTAMGGSPFPSGSSVSSLAFGADGQFLYAANATGGDAAVYAFSVDPVVGELTSLPGFPFALPSCDRIVADQTGTFLFATTGASVLGFRIDSSTGTLSPLPGFPISTGARSGGATIDPTNQFLYVADTGARTVTGFELNGETGELTPMAGSPFAIGATPDLIVTF